MPLNYSIAMLKNPQKQDEEPKAYAKSQITGELTLKELGQQVASQTTVSRADVAAVIISTVENMIGGLRAANRWTSETWENSGYNSTVVRQTRPKNSRLPISPE